MSTITESSIWSATVNQIESGEILKGGIGNALNQSISELTNRSLFIKDRLDDASSANDKIWSASKIHTELNSLIINKSIQNSNYTVIEKNEFIFADTSGGSWILTLPNIPVLGDMVEIADLTGDWGNNNLTISRNGNMIQGLAEDMICDIMNCSLKLVYSDVTNGWKIS